MNQLRIGMVGFGFIADRHYEGFQSNPDATIVGLCHDFHGDATRKARQRIRLEEKCREWNLEAFDSFEEMAASPDIDTLVIGSITPFHYRQIKVALANRKHILVEKPVVTDCRHVSVIQRLSQETGGKIFPAHNFVYRRSVIQAREAILAGEIGRVIHSSFVTTHSISEAHATGWRSKKSLASGGALFDSGHHLIYQSLFLLGMPSHCHAFTSRLVLTGMECEDTAQLSLRYPDGSMSVILQSWASNFGEAINGIRIFGDKGTVVLTDALYVNGRRITDDVGYSNSFQNQARAFSDYILREVPPLSGLDDVRNTLKITHSAYESAETQRTVGLVRMTGADHPDNLLEPVTHPAD